MRPDGTPATQSATVASTEGRGRTEPGARIGSVIVASPSAVKLSSDTPKLKGMAERKVPPSADCCGVRGVDGGPGGAGAAAGPGGELVDTGETVGPSEPLGFGEPVWSRSAMAPRRYPCGWGRTISGLHKSAMALTRIVRDPQIVNENGPDLIQGICFLPMKAIERNGRATDDLSPSTPCLLHADGVPLGCSLMSELGVGGHHVSFPGVDGDLTGVLCSPAGDGVSPAILVLPEIDGFCDGTVAAARRLAASGYVALALDPFAPYGSTPVLRGSEATWPGWPGSTIGVSCRIWRWPSHG